MCMDQRIVYLVGDKFILSQENKKNKLSDLFF